MKIFTPTTIHAVDFFVLRFGLKLVLPQNLYSVSLWAEARGLGLLAGYSILHTTRALAWRSVLVQGLLG